MSELWQNVTTSEPTNAELQDAKSRMNVEDQVQQLGAAIGEIVQSTADFTSFVRQDNSPYPMPVDDGAPPAAPTGVVVTPVPFKELDVTWNTPPAADFVTTALIGITPSGGSETVYKGNQNYGFATGLTGGVVHSVRVAFVDAWGHQSAWSSTVTATPMLTAAEQIDLDALAILGRLQGLLPNAHLDTITDAAKLGSGVVTAAAMAVQDAVAINLWVQNAAIQSAKIATLVADKIDTGSITAATITISASGKLQAGGTKFAATGIEIQPTTNLDDTSSTADYRISTINSTTGQRFSSLHFYTEETTAFHRGLVIRSDGTSTGTTQGVVEIHAPPVYNSSPYQRFAGVLSVKSRGTTDTYGSVSLWPQLIVGKGDASGPGSLLVDGDAQINADLSVGGEFFPDGGIDANYTGAGTGVSAGGSVTWTHNLGELARIAYGWVDRGSGTRGALPIGSPPLEVQMYSNTQVRINNGTSSSWTVGIELWRQ